MSSYDKGNGFELKVLNGFKRIIEQGEMPGVSRHYSIFHKKKYKSIDSNAILNPDITIEVYHDEEDKQKEEWCNLFIIECKDNGRKISNPKYRELIGNRTSYPKSGVKLIMISSAGFSKPVIDQAQSDHTALISLSNEDEFRWLVKRQIHDRQYKYCQERKLAGELQTLKEIVVWDEGEFCSISDILKANGLAMKCFYVPYLTVEEIESKAQEVLTATNREVALSNVDRAVTFLKGGYRFDFVGLPENTLGYLNCATKIITISSDISIARRNFTIAHEIGHILLHQELIEEYIGSFCESEGTIEPTIKPSDKMIARLEWQANMFASFILLPLIPFVNRVNKYFADRSITTGYLFVDFQRCNRTDSDYVIGNLSQDFSVSKEVIKIRMQNLGLLKYGSDTPKRVREIPCI